jgi:glucokinase
MLISQAGDKLDRQSKLDRKSKAVIGVDIGGTNIKIALVDPREKRVLRRGHLRTLAEREPEVILADLGTSLAELSQQARKNGFSVAGVGVGCAGLIDLPNGVVITSPNLPGWINFPLGRRLGKMLEVPVFIENDVNCICYGEYWLGAGRALGDFIGIAPGTGVGGCLMVNGKVWQGQGYSAGEIGHMTIQPDGDRCLCGNHGCLETLASASWLVRRAEEKLRKGVQSSLGRDFGRPGGLDAELIYRAAMAGDKMAQELFHVVGCSLAIAIANVVHVLGIPSVLIAGGMANGWEAFIGSLRQELDKRLTMIPPTDVRVVRAQMGDEAGAFGGAYLAASEAALITDV